MNPTRYLVLGLAFSWFAALVAPCHGFGIPPALESSHAWLQSNLVPVRDLNLLASRSRLSALSATRMGLGPRPSRRILPIFSAARGRVRISAISSGKAYVTEVCDMLGIDAANATSNVYVIALEQQKKDMETELQLQKKDMETELQLQKKDMEKDLQLQKKDMEKELQLQKKDMEKDLQQLANYYKCQLSFLTQRYILEKLFRKVVQIVEYSEDGALQSMLSKKDLNAMLKGDISMTAVNRLLKDEEHARFRRKVWETIGVPQDLVIPTFDSKTMLYGQLSEVIHGSSGKYVYLPSNAGELEIRFFGEVSKLFEKDVDYFDVVSVNAGETLEADFPPKNQTNSSGYSR
ncbi:hypothetical protein GUITHDRAFT_152539 [Guillardia theta CCMP2712]|uniref:Uncharacterized protein n=1 Tax=Guillardia theta (strain CCMP2712) TaxID=905079 RepID=L1JC68_GUITC|nr:hypothetical protein GUITHDRAFT_152539 [Guillardia theta CCMP2712]EKX46143.1 hypothetical protein GUITHDRAFT_152539 [Guillardia theta CCMP2712]|eukprot:XP_005833123.1 hypothetical protein GUITHDRAFT_152539 [Guillardia theta CCMP2712]